MDFLELLDYKPTPLFGSEPDINAYIELHNLIAAAESIEHFSRDDLDRISRQRDVDLKVAFTNQRVNLYQDILDGLVVDGDLEEQDRKILSHVAHTLALTPALLREAHERAFGNAVTSSISDDCLDLDERLLLYKLQHMLGLDPEVADKAYGFLARERLLKTIARVLCDGELSPDEAQDVETVRDELSLEIPERLQQMLNRAADRWAAKNPQIEPVHVHFKLKEDETAYYTSDGITWTDVVIHDVRRILSMADDSGPKTERSTRHVRMPDAALDGDRQRGRLTITSHRLVLSADGRGQQSVNLRSLDAVRLFANGVTARTGGGWHVFFDLGSKSQRVHWVLGQLVKPMVQPLAVVPRAPSRGARWRKVRPDEIRAARLDEMTGAEASLRVLDRLDASPELWEESGRVRFSRENVVFDGSSREDVRLSTVAKAVRRGALVWMPLGLAQGWLVEFREESNADAFVRLLRERKSAR
ncbi:MAG: hypothetical protein AAF170_11135 [Bacteroidota bacterium]